MFSLRTSRFSHGSLASMAVGLSAALFGTGCASNNKPAPVREALVTPDVVSTPVSPVPEGQTLSEFLDEITTDAHTLARGTTFIRSYKENFMTKRQYTLNLVQRYAILSAVLDEARGDARTSAILGAETTDLLAHFGQDLEALGKPVSSITKADLLESTKQCLLYIHSLSPHAQVAVAHIFVGGAGNGGKHIGQGIQRCLGPDTPVFGFSGTPHEAVDSLQNRIDLISPEHHQAVADAEVKMYDWLYQINQDRAFDRGGI